MTFNLQVIILLTIAFFLNANIAFSQTDPDGPVNPKISTYFSIVHPIVTISENSPVYNF